MLFGLSSRQVEHEREQKDQEESHKCGIQQGLKEEGRVLFAHWDAR
jgi:hypothetical protein